MGPLVITSNQCQLDSGRVPYGVGEASGTRNFKLWVIITIVVVCRSPVRMWIDLVDGKQTNKQTETEQKIHDKPTPRDSLLSSSSSQPTSAQRDLTNHTRDEEGRDTSEAGCGHQA